MDCDRYEMIKVTQAASINFFEVATGARLHRCTGSRLQAGLLLWIVPDGSRPSNEGTPRRMSFMAGLLSFSR